MAEDTETSKKPEEKSPRKWFKCSICSLKQEYHIKGREYPSAKSIKLKEDSYLMPDPFVERGSKNSFLVIGSDCVMCKNQICQSAVCSIYYKNRFCLKCASAHKNNFPQQLHSKIKITL